MKVDRIDHFVLTVNDIEKAADFYSKVFGMQIRNFAKGRTALFFGCQKINLHQNGTKFDLNAKNPTVGSGDVCFITDTPIEELIAHIKACNVEIVWGPIERAGATGPINSIYVYDPDGNIIEIANYGKQQNGTAL